MNLSSAVFWPQFCMEIIPVKPSEKVSTLPTAKTSGADLLTASTSGPSMPYPRPLCYRSRHHIEGTWSLSEDTIHTMPGCPTPSVSETQNPNGGCPVKRGDHTSFPDTVWPLCKTMSYTCPTLVVAQRAIDLGRIAYYWSPTPTGAGSRGMLRYARPRLGTNLNRRSTHPLVEQREEDDREADSNISTPPEGPL